MDTNNNGDAAAQDTTQPEDDPQGTPPFGAEGPTADAPAEQPEAPAGDQPAEEHTFPKHQEELAGELASVRDVLDGKTKWGQILKGNPNMADALAALQICFKYHPNNDGKNPNAPRQTLGDIEAMREDLMHLSAIGVRLGALAAYFESAAKAADNERKLARSRAWARVDRDIRAGKYGSGRFTVDDKKNFAEASIADYYTIESRLQVQGRILSWVRASGRDMVESFQVLIRSALREERGDAKLH